MRSRWTKTVEQRFWEKVEKTDTCWLWTARRNKLGYGCFWPEGRRMAPAHRWAYEAIRGAIPAGLDLDHLCRVRHCVNPDHLEPVTHRENVLRGDSARSWVKTHCPHGHAFTPENTYVTPKGSRMCIICRRAALARYRSRLAEAK